MYSAYVMWMKWCDEITWTEMIEYSAFYKFIEAYDQIQNPFPYTISRY